MAGNSSRATNWREWLAGGLHYSGALRLCQRLSRDYEIDFAHGLPQWRKNGGPKFLILCYHRVGSGGVPLYSALDPRIFEKQMRFVTSHFRVVSLDEMMSELQNPGGKAPAVAVTFDDGYRDTYHHAFPILQKYGVPATVYLTVDCIETGEAAWYDRIFLALQHVSLQYLDIGLNGHGVFSVPESAEARIRVASQIVSRLRRLPDEERRRCCAELERRVALPRAELAERMLTWEQLRQMQRGGISFGSHTMDHPVVSQLDTSSLQYQLAQSKRILEEHLQTAVQDFAYPFGQPADCGLQAGPMLKQLGYRSAATTVWGMNTREVSPLWLRRVPIEEERTTAMFSLQVNRVMMRGTNLELEMEARHGAGDGK